MSSSRRQHSDGGEKYELETVSEVVMGPRSSSSASLARRRSQPPPEKVGAMMADLKQRQPPVVLQGGELCEHLHTMELCELRLLSRREQYSLYSPSRSGVQDDEHHRRFRASHPLLCSMLQHEERRTKQLELEGAMQIQYPKGNAGWFTSLRVIRGRAMTSILGVWSVVVLHAVAYTCYHEFVGNYQSSKELSSWETFFGIALNATLGLMLVFRLNRAAARWWLAREYWGVLVAKIRDLVVGILVHGGHDPVNRDETIRWIAAYPMAVMEFLRGCDEYDEAIFAGILSSTEVDVLKDQRHPPLYVADQARYYLKRTFAVTAETPLALSMAWSQQLAVLEEQWTIMLDKCGGMERIKGTPLPIVYVSHLRTFLVISLLLYPYVWGREWGWGTIPIVALAAFCLLGIEAASVEVEQPFKKNRINALNMDGFCYGALSNILQLLRQSADRDLREIGEP